MYDLTNRRHLGLLQLVYRDAAFLTQGMERRREVVGVPATDDPILERSQAVDRRGGLISGHVSFLGRIA